MRSSTVAVVLSLGLSPLASARPPAVAAGAEDGGPRALRVWADEVKRPRRTVDFEPRLPEDLARRGFGDDIVVECTLGEDGSVTAAKALNGVPELREVAEAAALQWKYQPSRKHGAAVRVRLHESVELWPTDDRVQERWARMGDFDEREEWTVWPEGTAELELAEYTAGRRVVGDAHRYLTGVIRNLTDRTLQEVHAVGFHRNSVVATPENVLHRIGDLPAGATREFVLKMSGYHAWAQFVEVRGGETHALPTRRQRATLSRVPPLTAPRPPRGPATEVAVETEPPDSTPPEAKKMTRPVYPRRAFDASTEGTVVLEIWIDAEGFVDFTFPLQALPGTGLDAAAIRTVLDWRFGPARKDGVPIAAAARAPVTFRIY